jgi:hypothetical protein
MKALWPSRQNVYGGIGRFFLLYAVLEVTPGFIYKMGNTYAPDIQSATLALPRAGSLRVNGVDEREYTDLATLVLEHARGPYLYCTPDCPEVYFLFGFRNPGRTLFDFFEEPAGRTSRILAESDLDWEQDLDRLSRRLRELRVDHVSIQYFGNVPLEKADLPPYSILSADVPTTHGYVAVSVRYLTLEYARDGSFAWLRGRTPLEIVGKSKYLYNFGP